MKAAGWAIAVGAVAAFYSACSPFQGKEMVNSNISLSNSNMSSSNDSANTNSNGSDPVTAPPASPSQTPVPSPSPLTTAAMSCPNRPSGAVTVLDTSFNTVDGEGQLWEIYPGAGKVMQPAGANGSVSASILSAGQSTGGQQTIWPKPGNEQPLNNIYMCMRWKMGKDFVGLRTGNKVVFLAAQDFTFGRASMNGLLFVNPISTANYPITAAPFRMFFGHNSGQLDNSHACSNDLGLGCNPNVNTTPLYPDVWYTVEAYIIASTCQTCRNATVKWWIDGSLQGNYTNLNYGDGIVNQWQINHTWDGSVAVQCGPPTNPSNALGRDCTKDQIHYFDHVLLAAVGGHAPANK